jgi:glycerol-3-phosphate dehydrogenase (NAD(P)+)
VHTAPVARALAHQAGVEMPLAEAVCAVLEGRASATDALRTLLAREPRAEVEYR